ncbi:uncharacterized protein IWZ02DRAFT_214564 [Phyllosticta citriasiana]|uniref:Uncharacterized protein n=1 Tax=Phyllosticta citriasiana TaxID=595635 RepID=A0ABR1KST6_9PEZI
MLVPDTQRGSSEPQPQPQQQAARKQASKDAQDALLLHKNMKTAQKASPASLFLHTSARQPANQSAAAATYGTFQRRSSISCSQALVKATLFTNLPCKLSTVSRGCCPVCLFMFSTHQWYLFFFFFFFASKWSVFPCLLPVFLSLSLFFLLPSFLFKEKGRADKG